jgi:hypothetical protein
MTFHSFGSSVTALVAIACSGTSLGHDDTNSIGGSGTNLAGSAAVNPTGGQTSSGGSTSLPSSACPGLPYVPAAGGAGGGGGICAGVIVEAKALDLDLYIMMDRSDSMLNLTATGFSRWHDVELAVEEFIATPDAAAIRMGIQFFSLDGGYNDTLDCNPSNYATPAVEIGELATTGSQIAAAIGGIQPSGLTPSIPALLGAVEHARNWAAGNPPTRATAVLLVTDGFATQCSDQSDQSLMDAALAGMANDPPIRTYVIGVNVGAGKFRLDGIASNGGTGQAYLTDDTDLTHGLVTALRSITNDPLKCEYQLPKPANPLQEVDPALVQVVHTLGTNVQEEVPYATTRGGCSPAYGGWYYDNQTAPTKLIMCPCTCSGFAAGRLDILVGCKPTQIDPR